MEIDLIRKHLKHKIINNVDITNNFAKEEQQLYNLIKLTITNGESQSVLIIGPRGTGKTMLVNHVLFELDKNLNLKLNSIVVKLNGLIHTDDKLALKDCTIQMNLENAVGGKVFSSFSENLAYLLECLNTGQRETVKCLLFVVDEFDLFCFHENQTLLYNLLDMTNYSQIPICVVGVTARLDIIELFEKRVKSRFSHRVINIFPTYGTQERITFIKHILTLNGEYAQEQLGKSWNKNINSLITNSKFKNAMERLLELSKCERVLKNILIIIVSELNENKKQITPDDFCECIDKYENGHKLRVLSSLSVLEMCLLIAMKHHSDIYDNDPFNFQMILDRYMKFANEYNKALIVPRSVVLKAFEHIKNLELISPVSGNVISNSRRQAAEYELYNLSVYLKQLEEVVRGGSQQNCSLPTEVRQWFDMKL